MHGAKNHRRACKKMIEWKPPATQEKAKLLVIEMDGGMFPIVGVEGEAKDLRKIRKVCWKEAELCCARAHGKASWVYEAIIGIPEEAGAKLYGGGQRAAHWLWGSGEIESSHRHVVQKRLKIGGAWWKTENANAMLKLRMIRANGWWEAYWNEKRAA